MIIDVQLNAATTPWPGLRDGASAAESSGFGAVWVFDHLAGSSLNGSTMLDAFTLLGALAATTTSVPLGSLVANVFNRAPAVLVDAAASVATIGARQVYLGIGAGASPTSRWSAEMDAVGQPIEALLPRRHARVEQVIDLCDQLWHSDRPPELATFPLPRIRPDVHIGVGSEALATLAGRRADGVNVGWHHPRRDRILAAACTARLGAHATLDGFTSSTWVTWDDGLFDPEHPERRAMSALGIDRLIVIAPPDRTAARLAAHSPNDILS